MTKTLNQFLEGYLKVKSSDEQKFVDKHVAVKNPDRNGNGDDVFNGNTKTINRRKTRKGYDAGDDAKVYEETDLDEALETERVKHPIGQRPKGPGWTLKSAGEQTGKDHNVWERKFKRVGGVKEEAELEEKAPPGAKYERMVKSIKKGYSKGGVSAREKAIAYATAWKAKKANEEAEQIDELSVKTVDSYREKAFAQQPAGNDGSKLYKKRKAGRDIAYKKVTHGAKVMAKEEAEQIDELSKKTLGSYIKKAAPQAFSRGYTGGSMTRSKDSEEVKDGQKFTNKGIKRVNGVLKATDRLTKEEAEQIDELSKKTLGSYVKKGMDSAADHNAVGDSYNRIAKKSIMKPRADAKSMADFYNDKANTRTKYVKKAVDKLTKEEAEQIDEISLDKAYAYKHKAGDYIDASNAMAQGGHKLSAKRNLGDKKRDKGLETAHAKIGGYAKVNAKEETLVDILSGLKESHVRTMVEVYESLSEENQAKFVATCKKDGGIDAMLNFAIKNRGE